jgi:hypothetical protein
LTISVYDLESALAAGDKDKAILQLGRLLMVSDSRAFIFDILLNQAASDISRAGTLVPFVHSCQRAYDFVGPANLPDFLLPALDAVVAAPSAGGGDAKPLSPWEVLPRLGAAPPELLGLAAHIAQIEADDHVKGPGLSASLRSTLGALAADLPSESPAPSTAGTVDDLLKVARDGDTAAARAISRALAEAGDRVWILDLLEKVGKISPGLLLWADSVRMLLRVAEESDAGLVGEIAGLQLAEIRPR